MDREGHESLLKEEALDERDEGGCVLMPARC